MPFDAAQIFQKVRPKIKRFGVQKEFVHLGRELGPQNPDWIIGNTVYEIYVRAFSTEGTFNAVTRALINFKKFGIDVIWLMPIFPIGQMERKGSLGSPYSIKDYFTVNPEYGNEEDFKTLVQTAHQLDMKIFIDMVPNHVAHDYNYFKIMPDLVRFDAQGNPLRKVAAWTDVVDLDYSKKITRQHMAKIMKFWIQQFDVDGYRCDVAGLVPLDFWEWIAPQLRALKPDFFLLAEWESPKLHQQVFNSTYDWSTLDLFNLVIKQKEPLQVLAEWVLAKKAFYPQQALPLRFLENHDLPRATNQFSEEQVLAGLLFIFSLHGIPLLYNGQEIGAQKRPSLFEKEAINWQNKNQRIYDFLFKLIQMRKMEKNLSTADYTFKEKYLKENIWFMKKQNLSILINFNEIEKKIKRPAGEELLNTKKTLTIKNGKLFLSPYQGIVFRE